MAVDNQGTLTIVPRPGHEGDIQKNPYIAYNALRVAGDWAVATNGTHTDPIAEKISAGLPVRDAMALSLLTLDYERDEFLTPRIAAAVPRNGDIAWLAIVRHDALIIKEISLEAGCARYLATYVSNEIQGEQSSSFNANSATDAAEFVVNQGAFADLENPVTSVAALASVAGFGLATYMVE
jgi:IMP cyclohydrolase